MLAAALSWTALMFGTAMVFLTVVDYSFDQHVYEQLQKEASGKAITAAHPMVHALGAYYEWRTGGLPLLRYFDILMACIVPLAVFGMSKEILDSVRGLRAPLLRHLLDVESLMQLVIVITIVVSQAAPSQARLVEAVRAAR